MPHAVNLTLPKLRSLAERLKWAREIKGWTQDDLALASGVGRDVIAKTETGKTRMPKQLGQLAQSLEIPKAWLAWGDERVDAWDEETFDIADAFQHLPDHLKQAVRSIVLQGKEAP